MVDPGATGREEANNLLFALLGVCALKNIERRAWPPGDLKHGFQGPFECVRAGLCTWVFYIWGQGRRHLCSPISSVIVIGISRENGAEWKRAWSTPPPRYIKLVQRGAAAAPEGHIWHTMAPSPRLPTGALALLRAPLLVPSGASVRGTKPREMT